jgi:SAM-dependent methyltransferase
MNLAQDPSEEQALARLYCPACGDWLVPAMSLDVHLSPAEARDMTCIGCRARAPRRDGVLALSKDRSATIPRRFRLGQGELSFPGLLHATLSMARNSSRTFQDEIYSLLSWLDPSPAQNVVLLGCAAGEILAPLANAVYPGAVIAMESDGDQIAQAHKTVVSQGLHNVVLVQGDLAAPPIRPRSIDRLVLFGVLHGRDRPVSFVERVSRCLRPDGVMVGVTLARSILPQIAAQQEKFVQSMGVQFTDVNDFGRDLCRGGFDAFQMDQASNWMARFVARKVARNGARGHVPR